MACRMRKGKVAGIENLTGQVGKYPDTYEQGSLLVLTCRVDVEVHIQPTRLRPGFPFHPFTRFLDSASFRRHHVRSQGPISGRCLVRCCCRASNVACRSREERGREAERSAHRLGSGCGRECGQGCDFNHAQDSPYQQGYGQVPRARYECEYTL
jgi:hypothetical protein